MPTYHVQFKSQKMSATNEQNKNRIQIVFPHSLFKFWIFFSNLSNKEVNGEGKKNEFKDLKSS